MKLFRSQMLYAFFSFFALVLVWRIRPKAVTNLHQVCLLYTSDAADE